MAVRIPDEPFAVEPAADGDAPYATDSERRGRARIVIPPRAGDRAIESGGRVVVLPVPRGGRDHDGMGNTRTTIAGIPIPDSAIAREATELVQDVAPPLLFHHSRRVFVWGSLQGEKLGLAYDPELFYVGAMLHDVGLVEGHRSEHERFEIDGANAARALLERHGLPEDRVMTVWEAIALHTTPEIPRYKQPEVRLVSLGVKYDVRGQGFDELSDDQRAAILAAHPRANFKEGIIAAFSAGIREKPETAFGTMYTDILEETVPGYVRPNFCDYIRGSRFAA
jgi:HD domain-containing protein